MVQSNGTTGPAAAAAPTDPTPGNPPPQAPSPDAERGGSPPPGPFRTPPPPPGGGADAGAGAGQGKPSAVSDFVDRLFGRRGSQDGTPTPDRDPEQPGVAARPQGEGTPEGGGPAEPALSPAAADLARQLAALPAAELSKLAGTDGPFARAVQSEIDRRTARANKERDAQGRFVRQQRIEGLKQQAREARQTDVYKAAELEEQIDGLQQQEAFVRGVVENYDRVSIDPLMLALPEGDRAALMADLPEGLDGRRQLVTAALARLKEVWQAEARGQRPPGQSGAPRNGSNGAPRRPPRREEDDEAEEPEISVNGRGRRRGATMNDWLRAQIAR